MSKRKVEKNEVIRVVKEISKKMDEFSDSVVKLQELKESIQELDEELAEKEKVNKIRLDYLHKEFQDNKLKAIQNAVYELGKVIISKEELDEMKKDLEKLRNTEQSQINSLKLEAEQSYNEKLNHALNVSKLQHDCETAQLKAEVEMHKKEVDNLRETVQRMLSELESQKKLTAEIANTNRPREVIQNK
jgi:hypothetical protein